MIGKPRQLGSAYEPRDSYYSPSSYGTANSKRRWYHR